MIQEITNSRQRSKEVIVPAVIQVKGLHKSFGGTNHVLKGVDLTVQKGENLVVLGKSGSGKSITIKCMVGLLPPDKGDIILFDTNLDTLSARELNRLRIRVGFLFQNAALYDSMTVR